MFEVLDENLIESVMDRLNKNFQKETILMNNNSYEIYFDEFLGEYIYIEEFDQEITKKDVKELYKNSFKFLKNKINERYLANRSEENFSKQSFIYVLLVGPSCEQNVYKYLNRLHSTHSHNFVIPLVYLRQSKEFVRFFKKPFMGGIFTNYIKARIDSIFLGKGYYLEYDLKDLSRTAGKIQFYGMLGVSVPVLFLLLVLYMFQYGSFILMFGVAFLPLLMFFGMTKFTSASTGSVGSSLVYILVLTAIIVGFIYMIISGAMSIFTLI